MAHGIGNEIHSSIHFKQLQFAAGRNIYQYSLSSSNGYIVEQGAVQRLFGCCNRPIFARSLGCTHQRIAAGLHNCTHVIKVEIYLAGYSDQIGNTPRGLQ